MKELRMTATTLGCVVAALFLTVVLSAAPP